MTTHDRWADRPARSGPIWRSLLLGLSVFVLAALTGALLAGATSAVPAGPPPAAGSERAATAGPPDPALSRDFARSMIYTGTAGLLVSVSGLVMIGRRRRLW